MSRSVNPVKLWRLHRRLGYPSREAAMMVYRHLRAEVARRRNNDGGEAGTSR